MYADRTRPRSSPWPEPEGEGARLNPAAATHAGEFGPDASSIHRVMSGSGGEGARLSPAVAHAGEYGPDELHRSSDVRASPAV
jgi:hypothetical protein